LSTINAIATPTFLNIIIIIIIIIDMLTGPGIFGIPKKDEL